MPTSITRFDDVLAAIAGELPTSPGPWSTAQHLVHCADSIDFAVTGYPRMKPAFIRGTIGKLVKRRFLARGEMHHDTTAPVAGTGPADPRVTLDAARARLRDAIAKFRAHTGAFAPHLVYGACTKDEYERLQSMHVADHLRAIGA
jgi:hypothetical protein